MRIVETPRVSGLGIVKCRAKQKGRTRFGPTLVNVSSKFEAPIDASTPDQSAATRFERRDILRATVFLCITPRATPRAISG